MTDLVIRGGTVLNGTGAEGFVADVGIDGDRIVAVGSDLAGASEIDATGKVVAPGFIDTHCHDDLALLDDPDVAFKVSQGVTTLITGNCGISLAPTHFMGVGADPIGLLGPADRFIPTVAGYRAALTKNGHSPNVALLAGHSSLRISAMDGDTARIAAADEQASMHSELQRALDEGAIGMSIGLQYPIADPADTDEVRRLTDVLDGGLLAAHIRDEGDDILEAIDEAVAIAGESQLVISHLKCAGPKNHGRSPDVLARLDAAGESVAADVYPYVASSTVLSMEHVDESTDVLIAECVGRPELTGRLLSDVAAEWGCSVAEAAERIRPATAIYFQMSEDDLHRIIRHPRVMVGSDGIPSGAHPHPRLWGTFPRVVGPMVRSGVVSLPEAIYKMTGLPASTFGLDGRGLIEPGAFADLVLFDADTIADTATYENPIQAADGIEHVFVNGQLAWTDSAATGARSGRFLTRRS